MPPFSYSVRHHASDFGWPAPSTTAGFRASVRTADPYGVRQHRFCIRFAKPTGNGAHSAHRLRQGPARHDATAWGAVCLDLLNSTQQLRTSGERHELDWSGTIAALYSFRLISAASRIVASSRSRLSL